MSKRRLRIVIVNGEECPYQGDYFGDCHHPESKVDRLYYRELCSWETCPLRQRELVLCRGEKDGAGA